MFSMISPFYILHSFIFCLSLLLTCIFFKVALQQIAGRNFPVLIGSLDASKFKGYVLTVNCLLPSVHLLWLADRCHPFTFKGVKQLVILINKFHRCIMRRLQLKLLVLLCYAGVVSSITREYFLAIKEIQWDYAPSGKNVIQNKTIKEDEWVQTLLSTQLMGSVRTADFNRNNQNKLYL